MRSAVGEQPSPQAAVAGRQGEGRDLVVGGVHSRCLGRHLIFTDGHKGTSHAGVLQPNRCPGEEDERDSRHVEKAAGSLQFIGADPRRRDLGDAVGAAGELDRVDQDELQDDPESNRSHGQIVAGELQRRNAQEYPEECRHNKRGEQAHPGGHPELGCKQCRRVGPHTPEGRLSQGELPPITQDNVQPEAGHGESDRQIHHVEPVVAAQRPGKD